MALLLKRRDAAVRSGLANRDPLGRIAERIRERQERAIAEARAVSRAAGLARLGAEVESIRAEDEALGLDLAAHILETAQDEVTRDIARARLRAASYSDRWLENASGKTTKQAAETASAATRGSLRRIAVTESSEAFSSGRTRLLRKQRTLLMRVWDATLDRRTCPICSSADGTIVGARENFPQGEPGGVHPWCRCSFQIVTLEEAYREAA